LFALLLFWSGVSDARHGGSPDDSPIIVFDRAGFLQSKEMEPPPADAKWSNVALPDSWNVNKRDRSLGYGWYRFTFTHRGGHHDGTHSDQRALYIPRITNNIEVFVNGHSVGLSGRLGPTPEEAWNVAQFFYIPASGFVDGENEILIRLHPDWYQRAGLSAVHFGPTDGVRERYERRYFIQTTLPELISGLLAVMAFFSLLVWARRRSETLGLLFGLMSIAAIARLFHHYLRDMEPWLQTVAVPALVWQSALQARVALHFAERPMPRSERVLMILAGAITVFWYIAVFTGHYGTATSIIYLIMGALTPVLIFTIVVRLSGHWRSDNILMLLAMVMNSALGVHDLFNFHEKLGFDRMYLLPLGLPLIMFAMAAMLVRRFVTTLTNYEGLNAELASRVASREKQLTESYEQVRALDQQRATAEERQRLMRDMHDGIGSHLMSTLALARMGKLTVHQMTEVLTDCIDELKITIDSLEPVERDLLVVLGNLRYRLEPRLNNAGISLDWDVKDLPPLEYLDPENVRSVLRIVQEAFTNTLKHAEAKRITLSTSVDYQKNQVTVRVADNGRGLGDAHRAGRGLENMRSRAQKLGGELDAHALETGGTCVNLYLPITRNPHA
jgi:signal transduction histidine kinase